MHLKMFLDSLFFFFKSAHCKQAIYDDAKNKNLIQNELDQETKQIAMKLERRCSINNSLKKKGGEYIGLTLSLQQALLLTR